MDTYRQAEGYFRFKSLEPTPIKGGKTDPIQVNKILSVNERQSTIHSLTGLREDFTGRKVELFELVDAVKNLSEGEGRIFSICGGPEQVPYLSKSFQVFFQTPFSRLKEVQETHIFVFERLRDA